MEDEVENKPWWNDGDKVGAIAATVTILLVVAILAALAVKLIFLLF